MENDQIDLQKNATKFKIQINFEFFLFLLFNEKTYTRKKIILIISKVIFPIMI